jgi:hypothetical protein
MGPFANRDYLRCQEHDRLGRRCLLVADGVHRQHCSQAERGWHYWPPLEDVVARSSYVIGFDPAARCPRCGQQHDHVVTYEMFGRTVVDAVSTTCPVRPGWRQRIARRLGDALAWVSKAVGQ